MHGRYSAGHGAAHHPTRAGHMLRGEAIVWLYALSILDAVYMLEQDLVDAKSSIDGLISSKCIQLMHYIYMYANDIHMLRRVPRAPERAISEALNRRRKT